MHRCIWTARNQVQAMRTLGLMAHMVFGVYLLHFPFGSFMMMILCRVHIKVNMDDAIVKTTALQNETWSISEYLNSWNSEIVPDVHLQF